MNSRSDHNDSGMIQSHSTNFIWVIFQGLPALKKVIIANVLGVKGMEGLWQLQLSKWQMKYKNGVSTEAVKPECGE